MNFHKGLTVQLTPAIDDLMYNFVQQPNSLSFQIVFSNRAIIKGKACYDAVHKNGHLGRTTNEMVGKQIFFSGQEKNKNKTNKKKTEAAFCMLLLLILSTR